MPPSVPLLHPREYFERHPSPLLSGLGVFTLHAIGLVVMLYAAVSLLLGRIENAPAGLERAMYDVLGTVALFTLVLAVVVLLVVAAIMHILVGGGQTAGTFGNAVAVAGWSYAPNALAVPVNYLLMRRAIGRLSFDGSDPAVLEAQMETAQDPSGVGSMLVSLLVIAWSVYILAEGVAGTHDVDVSKAAGPALLIGVGAFLMSVL